MKKLLIIFLVAFIIIQFFPVDKSNPPVNQGMDFLHAKNTPEDIASKIRTSCYDCHSNETKYPWYSNIQPIGWFLKDHIDEGRKHLNFSIFATYEPKRQAHKISESVEMIETEKMPLESYLLGHHEAKMTQNEKKQIVDYLKKIEADTRLEHNISMKNKKDDRYR